jgi:hypothetical protein
MMSEQRWALRTAFAGLLILACGCGSELDDGYKPRPLSASTAQRRGFYATPFTPEANAAQQEHQEEFKSRRPGAY